MATLPGVLSPNITGLAVIRYLLSASFSLCELSDTDHSPGMQGGYRSATCQALLFNLRLIAALWPVSAPREAIEDAVDAASEATRCRFTCLHEQLAEVKLAFDAFVREAGLDEEDIILRG